MVLTGKNLAVFGDSIMYGSGNNGFGVGEFLVEDFGFKLVKYCIGGARTGYYEGKNWIIDQVRQAISDGIKPDYIIFDGFTNDCYKTDGENYDVPLGEVGSSFDGFDIFNVSKKNTTFSNCFENIICAFKKYFPCAKILFIRPHKMGRREEVMQRVYGERAVEICKKWGVAVADIYEESDLNTFLPEHRDKYTNDSYGWGVGDSTHPNTLGYREKYIPIIERKIKEM